MTNRIACATLLLSVACFPSGEAHPRDTAVATGYVDSILPIPEQVRRFTENLAPVSQLAGGTKSRDALVTQFAKAVERADTTALRRMVLSRAEFAYLYYPFSQYTHPPYTQ